MASSNYLSVLKSIQTSTTRLTDKVNLEQPVIQIDLDTRAVTLPKAYQNYLAIQNDHVADSVYFCVDRYFDGVDLSTKTCVVEYINANSTREFRIAPIFDIDITTDPTKMYFAWKLARGATKYAGRIQFALRFYEIDPNKDEFVYNLSTSPCVGKILQGLGNSNYKDENDDDWTIDEKLAVLNKIKQLEQKAVVWADLT